MSDSRSCATCNAWFKQSNGMGLCRALPPTPVMVGMEHQQGVLDVRAQAVPLIVSYFPQMQSTGWCRKWERVLDA